MTYEERDDFADMIRENEARSCDKIAEAFRKSAEDWLVKTPRYHANIEMAVRCTHQAEAYEQVAQQMRVPAQIRKNYWSSEKSS